MKKQTIWQTVSLTVLRIVIGWHFLFEGLTKVTKPDWSAAYFLNNSTGPFSSFFNSLAANPTLLGIIDFLNEWGLVAIGLSLILGFFVRLSTIAGIVLLVLYYLANPPFIGLPELPHTEGNYLIVNKNLIELFALWVLYQFHDSKVFGLDFLFNKSRNN